MARRENLQDECVKPAFRVCFEVVLDSLQQMANDGGSKALDRLRGISRFDFIMSLVVADHLLQQTVPLSLKLHAEHLELLTTAKEAKIVIKTLEKRNDDTTWPTLYNNLRLLRWLHKLVRCQINPEQQVDSSTDATLKQTV